MSSDKNINDISVSEKQEQNNLFNQGSDNGNQWSFTQSDDQSITDINSNTYDNTSSLRGVKKLLYLLTKTALIKALNKGCGSPGLDLNSG